MFYAKMSGDGNRLGGKDPRHTKREEGFTVFEMRLVRMLGESLDRWIGCLRGEEGESEEMEGDRDGTGEEREKWPFLKCSVIPHILDSQMAIGREKKHRRFHFLTAFFSLESHVSLFGF